MLKGTGEVTGLSENRPPYKNKEVYEFHKNPFATAGSSDCRDRPLMVGVPIWKVESRESEMKSLSEMQVSIALSHHYSARRLGACVQETTTPEERIPLKGQAERKPRSSRK